MATKTFEELKQLAIQIRDEKTNKQNTATRVGTAMLEHINKLEQDYYDKTQTDEELKERDDKLTELENKSNKTVYTLSSLGNQFIKELYFTEKFQSEKNWNEIYIYQVRRNASGLWMIVFSDDKSATNSFVVQSNQEDFFIYNEYVYAIVNWDAYNDGTHYVNGDIQLIKNICINSVLSPSIYFVINITNETGESKDKVVSQFLLKKEIDKISPNLNYFSFTDDDKAASEFIKEIYISDKFLETRKWDDLYICQRRKNYGETNLFSVILSNDKSATDSFSFNALSDDKTLVGSDYFEVYMLVDWSKISDGIDYKVLHLSLNKAKQLQYNPYISSYLYNKNKVDGPSIKSMDINTNTHFKNLLGTVGKTPMITWIDDDGVYSGIEKIKPIFEELGISVTFGIIPPISDIAHDSVTREQYFHDLQKKGHHFTTHPKHDKWYGESIDIKTVESSLIECMVELQNSGFLHSDYLIYPGYGDYYEEIREVVKKWCKAGIIAGFNETLNHLGDSTRWRIKRCFIEFSPERTLDWYKSLVDKCYSDGDWLIFGTHSNGFIESDDTSDGSINNTGNLKLLWEYVINKKIKVYTLHDAFSRREYLFVFNEINQ